MPRSFLPVSLQVLYGFYINEKALKIQFDHKNTESSFEITVTHPTLGEDFPGFSMIYDIVYKFTKQKLQISAIYIKLKNVSELLKKGYGKIQSGKALSSCQKALIHFFSLFVSSFFSIKNRINNHLISIIHMIPF